MHLKSPAGRRAHEPADERAGGRTSSVSVKNIGLTRYFSHCVWSSASAFLERNVDRSTNDGNLQDYFWCVGVIL